MDTLITSIQNSKVKLVLKLYNRRQRDKNRLFLIEGYRELLRASEGGQEIETLFVCKELFLGSNERKVIEHYAAKEASIVGCTEKIFRTLSYRDRPDGLLAIAPQQPKTLSDLPSSGIFIVAEAIEKPGNLGTILRSADSVGASSVIICDRCTDIYNPNVVRASVGTLFTLPVVEASSEEALSWLRSHNIKIAAATPYADLIYTEADLSGPLAIVVGTEQYGLSSLWLDGADLKVKIPMLGRADSLNVAMATTLLLYEALRQKSLR